MRRMAAAIVLLSEVMLSSHPPHKVATN